MTGKLLIAEAVVIGLIVDARKTGSIMSYIETKTRLAIRRRIVELQSASDDQLE